MVTDDPFEPKLGRIRAQRPKVSNSFKNRVVRATMRAGGPKRGGKGWGKSSKFGRGGSVARVLGRNRHDRRVVVKARIVGLTGGGRKAALAHLSYIQRDGVTREGAPGELYGKTQDRADSQAFIDRADGDRHQFRFIVAPENADQYDDLKPFTRKLMAQMEADLGTTLDWVAVDHHNTGHPHTHIIVRGKREDGQDLVIAKECMSQGFRERAEAIVTLDLGPRSDLEIAAQRRAEIAQSRLPSIDRALLHEADETGRVTAAHRHPEANAVRIGRLTQLEQMGLAENLGNGQWQLRSDMEATLRQMGMRGDIIKTMHTELKKKGLESAVPDSVIHDASVQSAMQKPVTGRVLARGLADEHSDRHYLLVEATDGRVHYVDIGFGDRTDPLGAEAIVRVTPKLASLRQSDHTIVAVAASNDGAYDVDAHLKFDRTASQTFAETHVRRLEAIRRSDPDLKRAPEGQFTIGPDYLEKAMAYEEKLVSQVPVSVEVVSNHSLSQQTRHQGITWLDRELAAGEPAGYAQSGFGLASLEALRDRQKWLVKEGLAAVQADGTVRLADDALKTLNHREMAATARDLARELGKPYAEVRAGELLEGTLRRSVTLGGGKYAVVERSRDFALVPWRPVLTRHIDKTVSGMVREGSINWQIGRNRGISIE